MEVNLLAWSEVWGVLMLTALFYLADGDAPDDVYAPSELLEEISVFLTFDMRMIIAVILAELFSLPVPILLDWLLSRRVPYVKSLGPLKPFLVRMQRIPLCLINHLYESPVTPLMSEKKRAAEERKMEKRGKTPEEIKTAMRASSSFVLPQVWRRNWLCKQRAKKVTAFVIGWAWILFCLLYLCAFALVFPLRLADLRDWTVGCALQFFLEVLFRPLVVALVLTGLIFLAFRVQHRPSQKVVQTWPSLLVFDNGADEIEVQEMEGKDSRRLAALVEREKETEEERMKQEEKKE